MIRIGRLKSDEIEFEFDMNELVPTTNPRTAITWRDDVVVDAQKVTIKISKGNSI